MSTEQESSLIKWRSRSSDQIIWTIFDQDYVGLDPSRGVLIFPDQTPFDPKLVKYGAQKLERVPEIYHTHDEAVLEAASAYAIRADFEGPPTPSGLPGP